MTSGTAPARKDAAATRGRLVRAALDLFAAEGYRGTTTVDIAARAGTAEATIYRHFSGKEALYNAALGEALTYGVALLRDAGAQRGIGCRERLARIGRALVDHAGRDPSLGLLLFQRTGGIALDDVNVQRTRDLHDQLLQAIVAGKQEGVVRPGAAELWAAVWLALVRLAVERVAAREWPVGQASVTATLDAAWDAIVYRGEPSTPPPG